MIQLVIVSVLHLPMEFRLLLSPPDNECVSPDTRVFMLEVGVAMLAGRDNRRSRSISDRRGRCVVSCKVITKGGFALYMNTITILDAHRKRDIDKAKYIISKLLDHY